MAIFIRTKNNSGQVSVCGDAYRGNALFLGQHLALLFMGDDINQYRSEIEGNDKRTIRKNQK
jgi:hypothetical protein